MKERDITDEDLAQVARELEKRFAHKVAIAFIGREHSHWITSPGLDADGFEEWVMEVASTAPLKGGAR